MRFEKAFSLNIIDLVKSQYYEIDTGFIIPVYPAVGALFVNSANLSYVTGYVRTRGRNNGRYPYNYLEMIDEIFGYEPNTLEVCSNSVEKNSTITVDINPKYDPSYVDNAETLSKIPSNSFDRWRCDPPYNERTAKEMYGTSLPNVGKLLKTGARICKPKGLMFLLLGNVNRQACPLGVKRIGHISISVIPNNEMRSLHIYHKLPDDFTLDYKLPEIKIAPKDISCNDLEDGHQIIVQRKGSSDSQAAGGDMK